ncbi:MAG: FAD-dependent oxidoreductase [Dethiosulfatibacter sp.]|nr:FAD-dependent oxidoreductase [Dethiosulfatibacter sp.]
MMESFPDKVDFLLVGGGHAHVNLIYNLRKKLTQKETILLVSEDNYQYYSGMASGFLEGIYSLEEMTFNLPKMCQEHGISFIKGKVTRIDTTSQKIWIDHQHTVGYQYLSLDIGSRIARPTFTLNIKNHLPIKPWSNLTMIKEWMFKANPNDCWILIGGGAAGVEIAFALRAGFEKMEKKGINITIIHRYADILKDYPVKTRKKIIQYLERKNITIQCNSQITQVFETAITLNNQETIPYQKIIFTTGPIAPGLFEGTGLKLDNKGYMLVDPNLRSISNPFVFGAGDCIGFEDYPNIKKAGVYAVRQASYLCENLVMLNEGKELKAYYPQQDYLSIMSLGHKKAILHYKGLYWLGMWPWKIKNWIDMKFVKKS